MVQMLSPISAEAPMFVPPQDPAIPQQSVAYDEEYEDLKARILAGIEQKKRARDQQVASLQEGAKRDINPWLKAGMAGIYGRDPLEAYQAAQMPIEAREAKIRELSALDFDDEHKRLIDLSKVVAQRMKAAQSANKPWKPEFKMDSHGRGWIYDPNKPEQDRLKLAFESVRNSPQFVAIQKQVQEMSEEPRRAFKSEQERALWAEQETQRRFKAAIENDYLSGPGMTPARDVGVTPARERVADKPVMGIEPSISEISPADVMVPAPINPNVASVGARPIAPKKNVEMIRQELAKMSANDSRRKILQAEMDEQLANGPYQAPQKMDMRGFAPAATPGLGKPQPVDTRITAPTRAKTTPLPTPVITEQLITPQLLTPAQVKMADQDAVAMSKYFETMPTQLDSIGKGLATVDRLHQATKNGETAYGPAADFWQKAGGIAAYFAPDGRLAQQAAGSETYFGELQNLVRDKIAALGAGTAVSNLDLIVTQRSLGDLTNTQQGRMQLLGVLKATMLAEQQLLQQKNAFKAAHPEITSLSEFSTKFRKQVEKDGPLYAIMPYNISKPSTKNRSGKANPLTEYVPIMRDRWIEQARKVNPKATDAALLAAWKNWADADNQVKMMGWKK